MLLWCVMVFIAPDTALKFHRILVECTLEAPIWCFETADTSELLNKFSQDMSIIELALPMSCLILCYSKLTESHISFIIHSDARYRHGHG